MATSGQTRRQHKHHRHHHAPGSRPAGTQEGGEDWGRRRGRSEEDRGVHKHVTDDTLEEFRCQLQNKQVQESDGSFFESYTSLAWRQENKRLRAASEDDKDFDKPPPVEIQFATRPHLNKLTKKEFELLYIEVLYTIKHKIGTTSGGHSPYIQDLFQYAKESFGVSPEDHARLLARATEEKPPIVILNVTVLEASGLEAKDADGFSDPYCMLGIMPGADCLSSDEEGGKGRGEKDRKKVGRKKTKNAVVREMLPAKLIKTTQVKANTLNPVWNEKFRFDLDDVHSDRLHLDIW